MLNLVQKITLQPPATSVPVPSSTNDRLVNTHLDILGDYTVYKRPFSNYTPRHSWGFGANYQESGRKPGFVGAHELRSYISGQDKEIKRRAAR